MSRTDPDFAILWLDPCLRGGHKRRRIFQESPKTTTGPADGRRTCDRDQNLPQGHLAGLTGDGRIEICVNDRQADPGKQGAMEPGYRQGDPHALRAPTRKGSHKPGRHGEDKAEGEEALTPHGASRRATKSPVRRQRIGQPVAEENQGQGSESNEPEWHAETGQDPKKT